jgi:site-specific recombinase XerD
MILFFELSRIGFLEGKVDIEGFIKSIDHLSKNTKRAYEQSLWQLHAEIKGEEPTTAEIEKFLSQYPLSTLRRHMAVIKSYWEFVNPGEVWPFKNGFFGTVKRKMPKHVSPEIVQEMAKQAESEDDRMFVLTLFKSGCRMLDLRNLKAEDIKSTGIQVKAKSGKYNKVPMTEKFLKEFHLYSKNKKGKIFPNSYNYYYTLLKKLGGKANHSEITPEVLRHSRVVNLLRNGMALPLVQRFIGQANINTVAIYLEIALEITQHELSKALEKADSESSF